MVVRKLAVILQREKQMTTMDKFYDPTITVADIEVWFPVSHRKAERMMASLKSDLGIGKRIRPTRSVARKYFGLDN